MQCLAKKLASPAERSGIMPTGYEYREYKNWRGIPKPPCTTEAEANKFWAIVPKAKRPSTVPMIQAQT